VKIKVLGPLEVLSDDGAPVDLGRRKQSVSNLRRLLEPRRRPRMAAEVIVSQPPG